MDDYSVIVSKLVGDTNVALNATEISDLKTHFKTVIPWTAQYKVRFLRKFELLGVSLLCWTDATIKTIGETLGKVVEICYKDQNFSSVEISVIMGDINTKFSTPSSVKVIYGTTEIQVYIREVGYLLLDEKESAEYLDTDIRILPSTEEMNEELLVDGDGGGMCREELPQDVGMANVRGTIEGRTELDSCDVVPETQAHGGVQGSLGL